MNAALLLGQVLCFVAALVAISAIDQLKREVQDMNANFQNLTDAIAALQTDVANEATVVSGAYATGHADGMTDAMDKLKEPPK